MPTLLRFISIARGSGAVGQDLRTGPTLRRVCFGAATYGAMTLHDVRMYDSNHACRIDDSLTVFADIMYGGLGEPQTWSTRIIVNSK